MVPLIFLLTTFVAVADALANANNRKQILFCAPFTRADECSFLFFKLILKTR
jgi:hypothetical protein